MSSSPSFSAVVQPRRARLSDTIAEQIEGLIASGELKPGDNLPPERDLSKQLDVSRPSLRDALLVLESRGLLQARRGGGYCVTDVTAPVITDPLVHLRPPCQTPEETGCFCSWRTFQRGYDPPGFLNDTTLAVTNPLTWRTNFDYASDTLNQGAFFATLRK